MISYGRCFWHIRGQGSFSKLSLAQSLRRSIFKSASHWGIRDPPDLSVSVYHTQAERVKGQSILRRYSPGPSGQSKSFKLQPRTMAATGWQWPGSDNKQIKRSAHIRFIASCNKGRPWSSLWGRLAAEDSPQSPRFLSRASPPPKGFNHKNSNEIGGTFKRSSKRKTSPVLFIRTAS